MACDRDPSSRVPERMFHVKHASGQQGSSNCDHGPAIPKLNSFIRTSAHPLRQLKVELARGISQIRQHHGLRVSIVECLQPVLGLYQPPALERIR
jgi:hypothetical protein